MERGELELILEDKLRPIYETISRLEKLNESVVAILSGLVKQEERTLSLRRDVDKHSDTFDTIFERLRSIEQSSGNKSWDIVKIAVTVACTLITTMIGWMVLK